MNLSDWCASKDHERRYLREPFSYAGKLAASNGQVVIITNADGDKAKPCEARVETILSQVLAAIEQASFDEFDLTKATRGKFKFDVLCPECKGDGIVTFENEHHDYEWLCKTCDGRNVIPHEEQYFKVSGLMIPIKYLRLMAGLKRLSVAAVSDKMLFRSAEGVGAVLAIKAKRNINREDKADQVTTGR